MQRRLGWQITISQSVKGEGHRRQDSEKSLFHKLYVGLLGGISKLLENRPRGEVATKADISGPIGSPKTSTRQIIINLIQNAFIKSILPGFEKEVSQPEK